MVNVAMESILSAALTRHRVMPVLVIPRLEQAAPLAEALASGGLTVFEITLRTPCALEAMAAMKAVVPNALIGAGTVTTAARMREAKLAGADFAVSPGTPASLWRSQQLQGLPLLPGFSTATEAMAVMEQGSVYGKFFPAEASGGVDAIRALAGPLPELTLCPTGGITEDSAQDYLSCPNVMCVGGSWIAPQALLEAGDYAEIRARAERAARL